MPVTKRTFLLSLLGSLISTEVALGQGLDLSLPTDRSDWRQQQELRQKEAEQRRQERLQKALSDFNQINAQKESEPRLYLDSAIQLASEYQAAHQPKKAAELFDEAVTFFKSDRLNGTGVRTDRHFWKYINTYCPSDSREALVSDLFSIIEKDRSCKVREIDESIHDLLQSSGGHSIASNTTPENVEQANKKLCQAMIKIRSDARSDSDPSLIFLLQKYASLCEESNDPDGAESALIRANTIRAQNGSKDLASMKMNLAEFYLRTKQYSKAEQSWLAADSLAQDSCDKYMAERFVRLATNYDRVGQKAEAEKIINTLLSHANDAIVVACDDKIDSQVDGYINAGDFAAAEKLLNLRLAATKNCSNDYALGSWRLKLSNLLLTEGKTEDSLKQFELVIAPLALSGQSTVSTFAARADLLERLGKHKEAAAIRKTLPPASKKPITIEYGLLAMQEIRLGHNTQLFAYDSSKELPVGVLKHGTSKDAPLACCLGTIRSNGNFLFQGIVYGNVIPPDAVTRGGAFFGNRQMPVPPDLQTFAPALRTPKINLPIPTTTGSPLLQLEGGDYLVETTPITITQTENKKPIRLFIEDSGTPTADIELESHRSLQAKPINFQIWYNGTRQLKIKNITGVVYAPNAVVTIPFNSTFRGALVANRIIAEGNNRIFFDLSLKNEIFK